jgi:hypothetical protein
MRKCRRASTSRRRVGAWVPAPADCIFLPNPISISSNQAPAFVPRAPFCPNGEPVIGISTAGV